MKRKREPLVCTNLMIQHFQRELDKANTEKEDTLNKFISEDYIDKNILI